MDKRQVDLGTYIQFSHIIRNINLFVSHDSMKDRYTMKRFTFYYK